MNRSSSVRLLTLSAVLVALSYLGSLLKLPSPTGTIALDSCPGFFAALALGPAAGGLITALGNLFTCFFTGSFFLPVPLHFLLALLMAVSAALMGCTARFLIPKVGKKASVFAGAVIGGLANVFLSTLSVVPVMGWAGYWGFIPFLAPASFLNTFLAAILWLAIGRRVPGRRVAADISRTK